MTYDEFMQAVSEQLKHIYNYASGFDISTDEFISVEIKPNLTLGSTVILFNRDLAPSLNNISEFTISEIGQGIVKENGNNKITTIFTLTDKDENVRKLTEPELIEQAVSVKEYYSRLAQFERDKMFNNITSIIQNSLSALENQLDIIYFEQEQALGREMASQQTTSRLTKELTW